MGITRLKVRSLPRAEARNSLFSPAFGTGFIPGCSQTRNKASSIFCMQKVSLSSYQLPVLFFFFFLVFLVLSSLNGSHFDPFTKFSFRISQLTFKGNFTSSQRSSLELFNIKKNPKVWLVHFHLEALDQRRGSRDAGRGCSGGVRKGRQLASIEWLSQCPLTLSW